MKTKLFALCLALVCLLTACAQPAAPSPVTPDASPAELPSEPTAQPADTEEPAVPETLSLAWNPEAGLNPYTCTNAANRFLCSLIYEGLFVVERDFSASNGLCASYLTSDDGLQWTFLLRSDARYWDGGYVTADDVVASLEAARNGLFGARLSIVQEAAALGGRMVQLTLTAPCDTLPQLLDIPISRGGSGSVGTGPYRGGAQRLVRNPFYEGRCAIDTEEIALVPLREATEIRDAFDVGSIDVVCTDPNAPSSVPFHTDYELWSIPTTRMHLLGFNPNSAVFAAPEMRRAVYCGIDRARMVQETMNGFGTPASLPMMPQAQDYDAALAASYSYNPDESAALVDPELAAQSATMIVSSGSAWRVKAAKMMVEELNALGFSLTLTVLNSDSFLEALERGSYDLFYGELRLAPNADLTPLFDGSTLGFPAQETARLLCRQALENRGNFYSLHKLIAEQALFVPIAFGTQAVYAARGTLSNLAPAPSVPLRGVE